MKRKFSKILGVGLTLALLASLLVTAVPVAAVVSSATVVVDPTSAEEADADYTIVFDVGVATTTGDTITIVFPVGTVVTTAAPLAGTVERVSDGAVPIADFTGTIDGNRSVVILIPTITQAEMGEALTVVLTGGITNPVAGHYTLTVETSVEAGAIESQTYTIEPLETAIADAEAALTAAAAAKTAYTTAVGDTGLAVYTNVLAAEVTLNTALAAAPAVTAAIVAAITDLDTVVGLLETETARLVAITNGNAALV